METSDDGEAPNYRELRLRDLRPMAEPTMVVGRVVRAERREVVRKSDGGARPVLVGVLADGTGSARFTWWDPPSDEVEVGTILRAANVQIREFRGHAELTFNSRTRVMPAEEDELPRLTLEETPLIPIADLGSAADGFRVEGRVLELGSKVVQVRGSPKTIVEGRLSDGSGAVGFTAWVDLGIAPGTAVRIRGAQLRSFRGQPQLSLDERSTVDLLPDSSVPAADVLGSAGARAPAAAHDSAAPHATETRGVAVGLVSPSGLVFRCPECRRTIADQLCRTHGTMVGYPDLRGRVVVDDGRACATVELDRARCERLLGGAVDLAVEAATPPEGRLTVEARLFDRTFGRRFLVRGRRVQNDYGLTVFAEEFSEDPAPPPVDLEGVRAALAEDRP